MSTDYEWDLIEDDAPEGIANWDAIANAIQAQLVLASGLAATHVIWSDQGRDRPEGSFISLKVVGAIESEAPSTPQQTIEDNPDSDGDDGEEILQTSEEPVSFPLRVQYFKGTKTGKGSAWAKLSTIVRFLSTESVTAALDESLVSLIECGPINDISVALETEYESRAVVDLKFAVIDGIAETLTYIETADAEVELKRADGTILPADV